MRTIVKISFLLAVAYGCIASQVEFKQDDVLWFPDGNGKLVPAVLTPRPGNSKADENDIHYLLYTKRSMTNPDELIVGNRESLARSKFVPGAPVKFMSHGFGGNYNHGFPWRMRQEFFNQAGAGEVNIILVDWSILAASPWYFDAVENSKLVGRKSGALLEWLISEGVVARQQIHIMGFSLGSHVAGIAGSSMSALVPRVTGLDPARPLLDIAPLEDRLDPSDGVFVDVIHTAGLTLAFLDPIGDADYYPNGGAVQPGCGLDPTGSCAHSRAPEFFEESFHNPQGFRGVLCAGWDSFNNSLCDNNEVGYMGLYSAHSDRGKYFMHTNSEKPYAQN